MTVEELVLSTFSVPLERCDWHLTETDTLGAVGHVGLTRKRARFEGGDEYDVGGIRFVVTRGDHRGKGVASRLMRAAHSILESERMYWAVLFTSVPDFYTHLGYQSVRGGPAQAMAYSPLLPWPNGEWEPVEGEW